jgi:chitinase
MNFTLRIRLCLGICALLVMPLVVAAPVLNAQTGVNGNGRILAGYWHDWETPVFIPLRSVPSSYDIIVVAFATYNGSGNFSFTVDPDETQAQFISDIQYLHTQGKKVLISLGGASETPTLASSSDAQNFATSAASIVQQFGFDGIDIDFENGAVYLNQNDTNINAPTTPSVVYLIDGLKQFHSTLPNAMVTMAPIANYLQAGYQYYGPGPYGDSNWNGAQLPVIQAISSFLSYVWPQYYNECNIEALDNNLYCEGTDGNLVAMSEMLLKGFPAALGAGNFTPLAQSKVLMGVPASTSASPGYLSNSDLEASFNYLMTDKNQAGTYTLMNPAGYPNTAGFMTWSINWDVYSNNGALGTGIHAYLASLPPVQGSSPQASFSLSDSPGSLSVAQNASGSSSIKVSSNNGFNSAVALSVSGLPAGVTGSFSSGSVTPPANGSATSTLTLTADGAATVGTATVTITGIGSSETTSTTIALTVTSSGTTTEGPYGGTPAAIPGTILAENYDTGGQGVGYNVTTVNGTANAYRSDGVDLEKASAPATGNNLGWAAAGQWFRYTVNVSTAGTYTVSFLVAAESAIADAFHLSNSAGTNLSGSVAVPDTGLWQTWTTVTATVTLSAGTQTLTLNEDAAGWNIDSMAFASSGGSCTAAPAAPTGLTAAAASSSVIGLNWTAVTPPANCTVSSYSVYRSTTSGFTPGTGNLIASNVTTTSYSNSGLAAATTYYYVVEALDSFGTSPASNQASATTLASGAAGDFIAINFEGPAVSNAGGGDASFAADEDFTGGGKATPTAATISTAAAGANAAPMAVYQTQRDGTFTYTIPGMVAGSQHTVLLHFAEIYFTAAGDREFDVAINGTTVLTNFDQFATAGGKDIAVVKTFTATANSNGQIVVVFTDGAVNQPSVAGLEIR